VPGEADDAGAALPPGYHLIPNVVLDRSDTAEATRQVLADLVAANRYAEASALARATADGVLVFGPCEEIADQVRADDPPLAARLYALAARTYQLEGFWATAGGEGLAAMAALNQVLPKLLALHREGAQ
jgi:hypothetical protein